MNSNIQSPSGNNITKLGICIDKNFILLYNYIYGSLSLSLVTITNMQFTHGFSIFSRKFYLYYFYIISLILEYGSVVINGNVSIFNNYL